MRNLRERVLIGLAALTGVAWLVHYSQERADARKRTAEPRPAVAPLPLATPPPVDRPADEPPGKPPLEVARPTTEGNRLLYTTYFYTAGEAVIHGYEPDTHVRIVSLEKHATVWTGTVGTGETALVPTGAGVFGFLADKKAAILVGTPSSCVAVGYFLKDQHGSYKSSLFYTRLPSSTTGGARVVAWAMEATGLVVTDVTDGGKELFRGQLEAGRYAEIAQAELSARANHVLQFRAERPVLEVEVYYDEGFVVPSADGRAAGKVFYTYVGDVTNGENDLILTPAHADANVTIEEIGTQKVIWSGKVEKGKVHAVTMARKYVKVTADAEIAVTEAAWAHYKGIYAEHHFAMGTEGTGIETDLPVTTSEELWIFSYYDDSQVRVVDGQTGKEVWSGTLTAGHAQGLKPGYGFYRVTSNKGVSVMGGASSCGADYSPAAGLFKVDEELLRVVQQIREERKLKAAAEGRAATAAELAAPLDDAELRRAQDAVQSATGARRPSAPEVRERLEKMKTY